MRQNSRTLQNSEFAVLLADMPSWQASNAAKTKAIESGQRIQRVVAQEQTAKNIVREVGGIRKLLVPLQEGASGDVAEATLGALQNVVRGNVQNMDAVRDGSGIPTLIGYLSDCVDAEAEAANEALETLNELTRGNRRNVEAVRAAEGIPAISSMLRASSIDSRRRKEALSTLYNMACESKASLAAMGEAGVVQLVLETITQVQSTYAKALSLDLLCHLVRDGSNCCAVAAANGIGLLLDVVESAPEILSRCRAADALEKITQHDGAFGNVEAHRTIVAMFALCAKPVGEVCLDATDTDVTQLLCLLQQVLRAAPAAQRGTTTGGPGASPRLGSMQRPNHLGGDHTEAAMPDTTTWRSARNLKVTGPEERGQIVGDPSLPVDAQCLHGIERAVLEALPEVLTDKVDVPRVLGDQMTSSTQDIVMRSLSIAMQAEDIGGVLAALQLTRPLSMVDAEAMAEKWLRDRPDEVRAYEEAAAAARSKAAMSMVMRVSAAKKAASSLARAFNVGGPRPEGNGTVATAWRLNNDLRVTSRRLIHMYAVADHESD